MELIVKSRNGTVNERHRQYIEQKLGKLNRFGGQVSKLTVELANEVRRGEGEVHLAHVTLVDEHGVVLRAEERASSLQQAIDDVQEKLQRQLTRHKGQHWRRGKTPPVEEPLTLDEAEDENADAADSADAH